MAKPARVPAPRDVPPGSRMGLPGEVFPFCPEFPPAPSHHCWFSQSPQEEGTLSNSRLGICCPGAPSFQPPPALAVPCEVGLARGSRAPHTWLAARPGSARSGCVTTASGSVSARPFAVLTWRGRQEGHRGCFTGRRGRKARPRAGCARGGLQGARHRDPARPRGRGGEGPAGAPPGTGARVRGGPLLRGAGWGLALTLRPPAPAAAAALGAARPPPSSGLAPPPTPRPAPRRPGLGVRPGAEVRPPSAGESRNPGGAGRASCLPVSAERGRRQPGPGTPDDGPEAALVFSPQACDPQPQKADARLLHPTLSQMCACTRAPRAQWSRTAQLCSLTAAQP